jgi:tRNA 2-selenouridine synthase SelU
MNWQQLINKTLGKNRSFQAVFKTPEGQEVLQHIAKMGFVFQPSMDTRGLTEFNEGRRSLALDILALCNKDEAAILEMLKTHQQEETQ